MPLYEYKCHKCGKTFEMLQKFSDEPVTIHADCGGDVEKLVSAPAFHLKGHRLVCNRLCENQRCFP